MVSTEVLNSFKTMKTRSWQLRREGHKPRLQRLEKLRQAILAHETEIIQALALDLKKPEMETLISEVYPLLHEINLVKKNLADWITDEAKPSSLLLLGTRAKVHFEPKGVVLIISPWNYPFSLALHPLISALAAGNCALLKPSELAPQTAQVLEKICQQVFPADLVTVYQGGRERAEELLQLPVDHTFFTGSSTVGKVVMAASAQNLTPVTLELGGKSPTIIDDSADLPLAAKKIIWGKFLNNGQTCIAPDYLLVQENIRPRLIAALKLELSKKTIQTSQIISPRHAERLAQMVNSAQQEGAELYYGQLSPQQNMGPIIINVDPLKGKSSALMREEIFGPILPILSFSSLDQAIEKIQSGDKPLALYIFSRNKKNIAQICQQTSSGGICINDVLIHFGNHDLPFGGIGASGMGHYHGYYGFKTFSHEKAILTQGPLARTITLLYPPYSDFKKKILRFFIRLGL